MLVTNFNINPSSYRFFEITKTTNKFLNIMKNPRIILAGLLFFFIPIFSLMAQEKGNGNTIKQERQLSSFDEITVGCAIHLFLTQGEPQSVTVETDENLQERLKTKVSNGKLELSCEKVGNASKMNVYITVPKLTELNADGASTVKSLSPFKTDKLSLYVSGVANVNMDIESGSVFSEISGASNVSLKLKADKVTSEISGASHASFTGMATEQKTEVSGAAVLKALELITDQTDAEVSGAGKASVMARKELNADLSGAGSLTYFDNSDVKKIGKAGEYHLKFNGMENIKKVVIDEGSESGKKNDENTVVAKSDDNGNVEVTINNDKIVVVTDDSVTVKLGNNSINVDEDGKVKIKHGHKKSKFNGHWSGLELGVNGYLTPNNDFSYPSEYKLLDQKYQKSINVNLNFWEQNINLISNHLGLVTGLGLSWNNYRFEDNVRLNKTDSKLELYSDQTQGVKYEKSKLVNTYLTLPLMLEVQSNSYSKTNSFHLSGGVVGGWRIGTHAKYVYDNGSRQKDKDHSDFYMNPFKLDAIVKAGWGVINLYATYSLTPMFQKNKGPELYPFAIGICLTDLSNL